MGDVGYTLQAIHAGAATPIVALVLSDEEAERLASRLWPGRSLWSAPGGCTIELASRGDVDVANEILGGRSLAYEPNRHRWLLHIHLVEGEGPA